MKLVDANILLYAVNTDTEHHEESLAWLDRALSGRDTVGFAWVALLAFVRLSTKAGLFPQPLTTDGALDRLDAWLGAGPSILVQPGPAHARLLRTLLSTSGGAGNLVNDAHLAALALEHKATILSYDADFARFPGVRWERPTT